MCSKSSLTLTISEFVRRTNISRSKLYSLWKQDSGPPFIKIGTRRLIPTKAAEKWLGELARSQSKASEQLSSSEKSSG